MKVNLLPYRKLFAEDLLHTFHRLPCQLRPLPPAPHCCEYYPPRQPPPPRPLPW